MDTAECWCGSGRPMVWAEGRGWGCDGDCRVDPQTVPDWPVDDH